MKNKNSTVMWINKNILTLKYIKSNTHARPDHQFISSTEKKKTDTDLYVCSWKMYNNKKQELNKLFGISKPLGLKNSDDSIKYKFTLTEKRQIQYINKLIKLNEERPELKNKLRGGTLLTVFFKRKSIEGFLEIYKKGEKIHIRFPKEIENNRELHNFLFSNSFGMITTWNFNFKTKEVWLDLIDDIEELTNPIVKENVDRAHLRKSFEEYLKAIKIMDELEDERILEISNSLKRNTGIQKYFKDSLVEESRQLFNKVICGINNCEITNQKILIASHIKPWRDCKTFEEAGNGHNGILLCPNHDKLFDQGYITIKNNTKNIKKSPKLKQHISNFFYDDKPTLREELFNLERKNNILYHNQNIFKDK